MASPRATDWLPLLLVSPILVGIGLLSGVEPKLALFAAFGLGFVLLTLVDLAAAVVALMLIVFAENTPLFSVVSATKVAGLLLALGWVVRLATREGGNGRLIFADRPALSYLLAILFTWIVVSMAWAGDQALALEQAISFLLVGVLYVIVYTAVRTRREAMVLIGGFALGATLTATYGLANRPALEAVEAGRLVSTVEDPNFLAATLIAGMALAGAGVFAARGKPALQVAAAACLSICFVAFVLTGSRGGILGLTVALIAAVVFGGRWRARTALAVAVLAIAAPGYYALYAPEEVTDRIESATQGEVSQREGRYTIWTTAWRMAKDNPALGVGVGNFEHESINYVLEPGAAYRTDRVIDQPGVAHNTYLGPLAELGVVGLIVFVSFIAASIGCAVRAARQFADNDDLPMEALSRGVVVACFGYLTAAFFVSAETNKIVWLLLALGPALLAVAGAGSRGHMAARQPRA